MIHLCTPLCIRFLPIFQPLVSLTLIVIPEQSMYLFITMICSLQCLLFFKLLFNYFYIIFIVRTSFQHIKGQLETLFQTAVQLCRQRRQLNTWNNLGLSSRSLSRFWRYMDRIQTLSKMLMSDEWNDYILMVDSHISLSQFQSFESPSPVIILIKYRGFFPIELSKS